MYVPSTNTYTDMSMSRRRNKQKKPGKVTLAQILGYGGGSRLDQGGDLYTDAVTHGSTNLPTRFERLELLGDAVIGLAVAEGLMHLHNEGEMTAARSKIVCRRNLNRVAVGLGLHRALRHNVGNVEKTDLPGNCLEAVVGAVFLDLGYGMAARFAKAWLMKK